MTTAKFDAHVGSITAAIQEWQRGNCVWTDALRRADVTAKGERALRRLTRDSSPEDVRRAAVVAAGANY